MSSQHVCIIMGLYNGERFLQEQLDSFEAQTHLNWSLIVSDDGSNDDSINIVHAFARGYPDRSIELITGPRQGFAKNFLSALCAVSKDCDYVAFSDQDDVWLPEKLSLAISKLDTFPNDLPTLICGRTLICDEDLNTIGMSPEFTRPPCFQNALIQNIGGGNTMVLNKASVDCLAEASKRIDRIVAHDWTCYQIVTGIGGQVIYEPTPMVLYRQHASNQIGSNNSFNDRLVRIKGLFNGKFSKWFDINIEVLAHLNDLLTPASQMSILQFKEGRKSSLFRRLKLIRASKVHRQTKLGNISLWVAILLRLA